MPITINGQPVDVDPDPRVSLLDLLRERLALPGTKKGCNQGACGACTVLVDGERILACLALAVQYEGRSITTIEGLAGGGMLHPLQQAFIEHDGFQCGYCTPGQICSAINALTGEIRIDRFLGSFDCGRILNPKTAASQFRGGIIMGLGLALMEETLFDERNGRIMNPSLAEYHVPVHLDVPEIEVMWTDIPDPHTPMGARGIGEIGITGTGAAVANAVFNATGKRIRDLPITLDKLL